MSQVRSGGSWQQRIRQSSTRSAARVGTWTICGVQIRISIAIIDLHAYSLEFRYRKIGTPRSGVSDGFSTRRNVSHISAANRCETLSTGAAAISRECLRWIPREIFLSRTTIATKLFCLPITFPSPWSSRVEVIGSRGGTPEISQYLAELAGGRIIFTKKFSCLGNGSKFTAPRVIHFIVNPPRKISNCTPFGSEKKTI